MIVTWIVVEELDTFEVRAQEKNYKDTILVLGTVITHKCTVPGLGGQLGCGLVKACKYYLRNMGW